MKTEEYVQVEYGRAWGGTTYENAAYGFNHWLNGEDGWYKWAGWPADSFREAIRLAKDYAGSHDVHYMPYRA